MHDTRRTRIVLGVLLAAALALITINYRGGTGSRVGGLRGLGGSVFGSVESAASLVTRPVAAFTDGLTGSGSQGKINALQRQVVDLRAQLNQQRLSKYDEGQLSQLLQLAGRGRYRIVAASVIAAGASYDDSVTIDAGRVDGIKPDETVLNGQGLVGTVTSVSATTSTVLLATDASVTVGVRLAGTGQIGVVSGTGKSMTGNGLLRLQVFDVNAILHPGQQLVTFGSAGGRPYVPGRAGRGHHQAGGHQQLADQGGAGPPVRRRHRARGGRRRGRPAADGPEVLRAAAGADPVPDGFSDRLAAPSRRVPVRRRPPRPRPAPPDRGADVRRAALAAALLLLAILIQVTLLNNLPWPGAAGPDLVLVVVVALALTGGPMEGMLAGFCAGLALDVAPPATHLIGQYALVFCLVGYGCGRVGSHLSESVWAPIGVVAIGSAAGELLFALTGMIFGDLDVTWSAVGHVLPASVAVRRAAQPVRALRRDPGPGDGRPGPGRPGPGQLLRRVGQPAGDARPGRRGGAVLRLRRGAARQRDRAGARG